MKTAIHCYGYPKLNTSYIVDERGLIFRQKCGLVITLFWRFHHVPLHLSLLRFGSLYGIKTWTLSATKMSVASDERRGCDLNDF